MIQNTLEVCPLFVVLDRSSAWLSAIFTCHPPPSHGGDKRKAGALIEDPRTLKSKSKGVDYEVKMHLPISPIYTPLSLPKTVQKNPKPLHPSQLQDRTTPPLPIPLPPPLPHAHNKPPSLQIRQMPPPGRLHSLPILSPPLRRDPQRTPRAHQDKALCLHLGDGQLAIFPFFSLRERQ